MQVLARVATRIRTLRPVTVLAGAWLIVMVYAFPGQMTADTFDHLHEARTGVYTDGHPPAMNVVFWLSELVVAGPLGVLLVQTLAFLSGLHGLLRRTFSQRRAAWIASVLFVFPPIMTTLVVVWKDSIMAAMLVVGTAALLDARRGVRIAGLVALLVASAVRYNAFAATFPLVVLVFEWRPGLHWLKRYAISSATWLAITAASLAGNGALADVEMHYWHSSLAVHDVVGTLHHVDGTLPDAELERLFEGTELLVHRDIHAHIRAVYTPKNFFPIVASKHAMWSFPVYGNTPAAQPQRAAIERAWKEVLGTYPGAYVEHRLAVMKRVLAYRQRPGWPVIRREFEYPQTVIDMGLTVRASTLQHAMTAWLIALETTPLFRPWIYLAVAVLLLGFTRRHRDVFALLASGILLELTLLVLAPTPDYRYSHWMVTATCISVVVLVARRARGSGGSRGSRGSRGPRGSRGSGDHTRV